MSGFQTAKKSISYQGVDVSAFNEPVSNSKFFEVGKHDVVVASAETHNYGHGDTLVVTWTNSQDATIKQFVNLFYTDKQSGKTSFSSKYLRFAAAFTQDINFRLDFFTKTALDSTAYFDALKGLKASIVIAPGKKGYSISGDNLGGYFLVDVASQQKLLPQAFPSMKEANDEAKNSGFKRAFNEVVEVHPLATEVEKNEQSLRLASQAKVSAPVAATLYRTNLL
jgi:hypothetical protein